MQEALYARRCAPVSDHNWLLHLLERGFTDEAIVADAFNVEQTSFGCKAYLAQLGKIFHAAADTKVTCIVDRRFGTKGLSFLVVLFDVIPVVEMQWRNYAVDNDTRTEAARGTAVDLAVEDQTDLARATSVRSSPYSGRCWNSAISRSARCGSTLQSAPHSSVPSSTRALLVQRKQQITQPVV
jgi:hypothetical protein